MSSIVSSDSSESLGSSRSSARISLGLEKDCELPKSEYLVTLTGSPSSIECLGKRERQKSICSKLDIPPSTIPDNTWTTRQIGELYNFPFDNQGECHKITVGIISLGGTFYYEDVCFAVRKVCGWDVKPKVTTVLIDGAELVSDLGEGDLENALDIQTILGIHPTVHVVLYRAPNTGQGFFDAFSTAIFDQKHKPSVISCSWAFPEWYGLLFGPPGFLEAFSDLIKTGVKQFKINFTVASGDDGSSSFSPPFGPPPSPFPALSVMFPGSSPWVTCVGGTTVARTPKGIAQTAWTLNPAIPAGSGGDSRLSFHVPNTRKV